MDIFNDLLSLKVFEKVCHLQSFSKAAKVLHFSQVMVSNRIKSLEEKLGVTLFERTTRSVQITSDGRQFLASIQKILATVDQESLSLTDTSGPLTGTLRLAAPPFFSRYHIAPYLKEFCATHPDLKIDIMLTENSLDLIEETIDFEIRIDGPAVSSYKQVPLFSNPKLICAAPSYLEQYGTPTKPEDLFSHNCLIFGDNQFWNLISPEGETFNLAFDGNVSCNNGEIIKELVLSGMGITLKSKLDIASELDRGELVELFPDYTVINHSMVFAQYPETVYVDHKITCFLDFISKKRSEHAAS